MEIHQKSILCHALFFQQAVIQNIDAPKKPITKSTFLKPTKNLNTTTQNLVFLVIRNADICVSCLVSTLDVSLSQVSVKKNMPPVLKHSQNCHASLTLPLVHGATGCATLYNHGVATVCFQSAPCTCKRHTWDDTAASSTGTFSYLCPPLF